MDSDFIKYLPAIYQDTSSDSFFARFTTLFAEIYLDFENQIENFKYTLDTDTANPEELFILADWLGFEEFSVLAEVMGHRQALKKAVEYYKRLGTKAAISEIITMLCGETPVIIEYPEKYCFTVLLQNIHPALPKLMEYIKPAYIQGNLVPMKEEIRLNHFAYLGINSYLGYSESRLNFTYLDSWL